MVEVAAFLRARPGDVAIFLRKRRLVRKVMRGTGRPPVLVTSARGVALAVTHFRAFQADRALRGRRAGTLRDRG